jgi:UDP-2,3-diacylglucosamine hydrolase
MSDSPVLGIIAGSGKLPLQLIEACREQSRPVFVLGLDGTDMQPFTGVPHAQVRIGAIGEALDHLRRAKAGEIVLAGGIKRPSLSNLRPDAQGAKLLARLSTKLFGGDDALLKAIVSFLEEEGFKVVGAAEVMRDLLAPAGVLGKFKPDLTDEADIKYGVRAAKALGKRDAGQAVIVENGAVLGEEDIEGTDALIARCASRKRQLHRGVLVKVKKPGQESRVDLPSIGINTVRKAHASGLKGIAVEAGASLILDKAQTLCTADELGIFVVGIKA